MKAGWGLAAGGAISAIAVPFDTIEKGTHSRIDEPLAEVYRTAQQFEEFWARHAGDNPPPFLDFDATMVAAVFWGAKGTGGHGLEVMSAEEGEKEIVVNYETIAPGPGSLTTQALTQPYHIVNFTRSEKSVAFEGADRAPPAPAGVPRYILSFRDGEDHAAIADAIRAFPALEGLQLLFDGKMAFVDFDSEKITEDEARKLIDGLNGVESMEEERAF